MKRLPVVSELWVPMLSWGRQLSRWGQETIPPKKQGLPLVCKIKRSLPSNGLRGSP